MKNEKLAHAMTHIDDDLITEAAQIGESRGGRILNWQRTLVRFGSLAACLLLAVGIIFGSMSPGVTMDGHRLDAQLTPISAASSRSTPQTVGYTAERNTIELTLDFGKSTTLTPHNGTLAVVEPDGSLTSVTEDRTVRGTVTLRLTLESTATSATVATDRGYDIMFSLIAGEWYVNIEK